MPKFSKFAPIFENQPEILAAMASTIRFHCPYIKIGLLNRTAAVGLFDGNSPILSPKGTIFVHLEDFFSAVSVAARVRLVVLQDPAK